MFSTSLLRFCALALLLALCGACELDGASKKKKERAAQRTPSGPRPPSTSVPLPPAPAHSKDGPTAAAPAGGWTQLDGRRAALEDYRGQVVVLDFYATYCPPCLEEIPHLVQLQRRYGPQGVRVIGLNVGGEEDQAKVPAFVRELGIQYQLGNPDDDTVRLFFGDNTSIPQTFVFDRAGRLVRHFVGFDRGAAAELEQAVEEALAAKAD